MARSAPKVNPSINTVRVLLVVLFVIWSNSFTAIKHLRQIFSPADLVLARFLPVSIFCLLYLLLDGKRRRESIALLRHSWARLIALGIFGGVGYNFFLYLGQSEIKPGAAALLTTLAPLFTLLLAIPLLKEKVPARRIAGVIIAFIGLYIVVGWGSVGLGSVAGISHAEVKYALILALAPLSWSIYTIIGKDLVKHHSPVTVTYLALIIGTVPMLVRADADFFRTVASMDHSYWIALAYLSILCTIIGFYIWVLGLKHLPATSVASFVYLNPPFAAFFGWLLFNEKITSMFLLGSAVVLAGLYLAQLGEEVREGQKMIE